MPRKPVFWIVFALLSAAAAFFTFRNFSTAFPLVSINLQMDRDAALRTARTLADKNTWPPDGFDQAAEFSADQEVQNFIELEGGGKPELTRILKEKIFAPYTWRVRHFKEADAHETLIRFTPEGDPYGFREKLPDQEKGESKPASEAQQLAESTARRDWNVDLDRYRLVESSKDVRPSGRTDHTFVYERQDEQLHDGRYRLRLVVGGGKLTELTYFVQIPEAFSRRYQEMRGANDAISVGSTIAIALYLLGFCGIGLFFMIRQRWLLWRQAAVWGVLIALVMGLQQLNSWPLSWMGYDTAVSASGFAARQIALAAAIFGGFAVLLTISFMAAETLSRRAFPHHVQLWKVWSRPASASKTVMGETLTGYLLVAPFFAYEVVLYFFAQEKLGWWTPSDTLVQPDMFANYAPSLSAIAQALQAGFWEECLFRAVPLAAAAIIGEKLGWRRAFIAAMMIVQALVFASGHAGYANQPAYARVVELIIPALAFGSLYLAFGLVPGIILHYAYDAVWMSLPLFVASGARAHLEQAIVILFVLAPLWVVLGSRLRAGRFVELPEESRNGAWRPREIHEPSELEIASAPAASSIPRTVLRFIPVLGLIGLFVWAWSSAFHTDAPGISVGRAGAQQAARQALSDRGVQLDSSWTVLGRVEGQPGEESRFVWQKAGREDYQKLLGLYLAPPHWLVRFARFQGDVAERAEEYQVLIDGGGRVFRVTHNLPEGRPGKSLSVDEARAAAQSVLEGLSNFTEVSAEAKKRPARTDWTFVFSDTRKYGLPEGDPRVSVEIAGDQVVDSLRYIYVPEEWERNERRQRNLPAIFSTACSVAIVCVALAGAIVGIIHWSRKRAFSTRAFLALFGVLFVLLATNLVNNFLSAMSQFSTAQPLMLQVGIVVSTGIVIAIFSGAAEGLAGGLIVGWRQFVAPSPAHHGIVLGVSLGATIAGLGALAASAVGSRGPLWGNFAAASTLVPLLGASLTPVSSFLTSTLTLSLVLYALDRRPRGAPLLVFAGLILAGSSGIDTISTWLIGGVVTGIVWMLAYLFVLRHQPRLIIPTMATLMILSTARDGLRHVYPSALTGSVAGAILVGLAMWIWLRLATVTQDAHR